MTTSEATADARVGVYLDVENLVVSQYDHVHGQGAWRSDAPLGKAPTPETRDRLTSSQVNFSAILDYAASIGVVTVGRAYANWSALPYVGLGPPLARRSVDLVQLFPLSGTKNGSDIRLATDVLDDLGRYPHLTHVLIAAGDSDYVPVAQKCRRLDKRVVGVGVDGSTSVAWEAACDEFRRYGALVGENERPAEATVEPVEEPPADLLRRALRLEHRRTGDDWVPLSVLKNLILRLNPAFDERELGHKSFSAFVRAHPTVARLDPKNSGSARLVELGAVG